MLRKGAKKQQRKRRGFTLLEALLASAISVFLLGGLYVVVELQVLTTQSSRDSIAQSTLARALMDRIARDMVGSITVNNPGPFRSGELSYPVEEGESTDSSAASSTSTGSTGSSGSTGSTGSSGSAGSSGSSGTSGASTGSSGTAGSSGATSSGGTSSGGSSTSSSSTDTPAITRVLFIPGIVGYESQLTAFQAGTLRYSKPMATNGSQNQGPETGPSCDIKRITYWVPGEGRGLARWESSQVTSPEVVSTSILPTDVDQYIVAPEVRSIQFSYSDGTLGYWTNFWDSRSLSYDNSTPQGPPRAVKIEVEMDFGDGKTTRRYSQVVALPTANTIGLGKVVSPGANDTGTGAAASGVATGAATTGSTATTGGSSSSGAKTGSSSGSTGGSSSSGAKTSGGSSGSSATKSPGASSGSSGGSKVK